MFTKQLESVKVCVWCASQTLPQRLVESEAREVEETQVLLGNHAVEVVTAGTNVQAAAASEDKPGKVLTHWAHSHWPVRLAVCNISKRET